MLDHDACYASILRRDPDADGRFFVGVKTTRIYCRPICPARTPLRRNVTFHETATSAREAGFRPCLRCRPESAPASPAWLGSLASVNRALRRIDEGALAEMSVEALADTLGMTGRHLRRLFVQHLGAGPVAIEQTRRIHLAKTLIHDTRMPMTEVAFAAGFGSLRRFNEAFLELFGRSPSELRREAGSTAAPGAPIRLRLAYRLPFDWGERLERAGEALPEGAFIEAGVYRAWTAFEGGAGRIALSQGPGRTLALQLDGVPVRHLARVIAQVKRDFLSPDESARAPVASNG